MGVLGDAVCREKPKTADHFGSGRKEVISYGHSELVGTRVEFHLEIPLGQWWGLHS